MDPLAPEIPLFWTSVAVGASLFGLVAAALAWMSVSTEKRDVHQAKNALLGEEAWDGAFADNESDLSIWLRREKINPDSAIADFIRACWAAWRGGRSATLTELHSLVARRERTRLSAKLSAGVAAILLVIGIVGTLSAVHPILKDFKLELSADGEMAEIGSSTSLVNALVNRLGDAFWPSLVALGGTIFVVSVRGLYTLTLHRFILELDRFAIGTLLSKYRPRTMTQEYSDIKEILSGLSVQASARESNVAKAVSDLKDLVLRIEPAMKAMETAVGSTKGAAKSLTDRSHSVAKELRQNLGRDSPLYQAVARFQGVFERTDSLIESLSKNVTELSDRTRADREDLKGILTDLAEKVQKIGTDHQTGREKLDAAVSELQSSLSELPQQVLRSGEEMVQQGLRLLEKSVDAFRGEQTEKSIRANSEFTAEASAKIEAFARQGAAEVARIAEAGVAIPERLKKLDLALTKQSEIEIVAVGAIRVQADEAKSAINEARSGIDAANAELARTTSRAGAAPAGRRWTFCPDTKQFKRLLRE